MVKVSVVIPTYNRKDSLKKTLDSLSKQSFKDFEIIVVDDGSNDGTEQMLKEYSKVKYVKQKNQGPGAARNNGIKHAKGEIISFTDDDCVVDENWIKEGIKDIKGDVVGVEGLTTTDHDKTSPLSVLTYTYYGCGYMTCNIFYRKDVLEKTGGFDNSFKTFREDSDLAWRILDKGYKVLFNPKVKVHHVVLKYSLKGFLKKHLRLKEIFWNIKLSSKHPRRYRKSTEVVWGIFSTQTLFHYLFFAALLLSIFSYFFLPIEAFFISLIILLQNYAFFTFLHTRMKSGIELKHIMQHKKEFLGLLLVWWIVPFYDTFWKVIGWLRFGRVVL